MTLRRVVWTVSELVKSVRDSLEGGFSEVLVAGEIGDLSESSAGHFYFTLKDKKAQIRAVLFQFQSRYLNFKPKTGVEVIARGKVSVYEPRGEMQLVCSYLEPLGLGLLQAALEKLKNELASAGYFDAARKRQLPEYPRKVGIVTSPAGAALYDMLRKLFERMPNLAVIVSPTLVQGEGAALKIAWAIDDLDEYGQCDVILVGRGGGSFEDLYAFNERPVCDAIFRCRAPVITGIGHEIDWTLADMVAHLRAPTPTAAAEEAVPKKKDIEHRMTTALGGAARSLASMIGIRSQTLDRNHSQLVSELRSHIATHNAALNHAGARLSATRPDRVLAERSARLNVHMTRLHRAKQVTLDRSALMLDSLRQRLQGARLLDSHDHRLAGFAGKLDALSPLAVLGRGYSIVTRDGTMELIRDASTLKPGDPISIRFHKGKAKAKVRSTES